MADASCSLPDCNDTLHCRGFCIRHYRKLRKYGDPLAGRTYRRTGFPSRSATATERFWMKVQITDSCWLWLGGLNDSGYGTWNTRLAAAEFRTHGAHRISWVLAGRELIDGLTLDHLCHTRDWTCPGGVTCPHRRCVNPAHLEQVPAVANTMRGRGFGPTNQAKSRCPAGHPYSTKNTYRLPTGGRVCRICTRAKVRRYEERKRART